MYSLRKMVWSAFLVVAVMLALIIILGIRQYQLTGQYNTLIGQSEGAIFHFATIRESVTEAFIEQSWQKLEQVLPEIEKLNSELARLQENSLIPAEFKLALVDKVDIAGMVISLRKVAHGENKQAESKRLQEQIRSIADHLLQYDRIIVGQVRARIVNFQLVIIGAMGLIISLASLSLILLYRNTVLPLLGLTKKLQESEIFPEVLEYSPDICREVAELTDAVNMLAGRSSAAGDGTVESERQAILAMLAETVNETTNQLNGIINYAQLLYDSDERELSGSSREMLQKIIASGTHIADKWQKIK